MGVALAIFSMLFPIVIILFVRRNSERINDKDPSLSSISSMFQTLGTSKAALSYHAYFMLRRLVFALTSIFLSDYPLF